MGQSFNQALKKEGYSDTIGAVKGPWPADAELIHGAYSWWRNSETNQILFDAGANPTVTSIGLTLLVTLTLLGGVCRGPQDKTDLGRI
jgi:hypothetical protein